MLQKISTLLLVLYLALFPFGQMGRIETSFTAVHLVDVVVGCIGVIWGISYILGKAKLPLNSYYFLVFIVLSLVSLFVNFERVSLEEFLTGSLYWLRLLGYFLFYFSVYDLLKRRIVSSLWLRESLQWAGKLILTFGLIQYLLLPDIRPLAYFGWDPHYYRLVGTFIDAGFIGIMLVLFTLNEFSRLWSSREVFLKWTWGILGLVGIALTFSRASYLALLIGIIILNIVRRKLFATSLFILIFLSVVIFAPSPGGEGTRLERTATISYRLIDYQKGLEVFSQSPLFGVGYNLLSKTNEPDLHSRSGFVSSLLFVLTTTGVLGFFTYLGLLGRLGILGWRKRGNAIGLALFSSLGAVFVHSFFDNSLFYPWVLGWMGILVALNED